MVSRKRLIYSRLLLVLTLILGWHLSSSFTARQGFPGTGSVSLSARPIGFPGAHTHVNNWFPPVEVRQASEAEPVIEEDDDVHDETGPMEKPAMTRPVPDEYFNALSVRTRLSQLASEVLERPTLDFFLLFHSWKTDPC